jgi:hypothetical protein
MSSIPLPFFNQQQANNRLILAALGEKERESKLDSCFYLRKSEIWWVTWALQKDKNVGSKVNFAMLSFLRPTALFGAADQ